MSKIKKVQIYVGAVGSAYVDKTNAQKNYNEAQQNVADVEAIIVSANSIISKIEDAINNADAALDGALALRQLLNNKLVEFTNDKVIYNKLKEIDEKLRLNDTDGIYQNGGNVISANNNKANAENQLEKLNAILADANILLEDNRKEVLNRKDEFDAAKEIFDTFIPNSGNTDTDADKEGSLNERINELENTITEIENASEAINNTTEEVTEEINSITNGNVPPVNPVDNTVKYWYAGQNYPFDGSSINITLTDDMLTDSEPNSWHIVKYTEIDGVNYLIKGIDSRSIQKTWYVITPKNLLTPVMADKQTVDTRFVFVKDVYVNSETYALWRVSNDVVEIINDDTSRLNIIMTSSEEVIVPTTVYGYWYIGTELPTDFNNMNFVTSGFGWRKIENPLNSYTKTNPLIPETITITTDFSSVDYFVILPQVFTCEDASGAPIFGNPFNVVTIENITYNIYKDSDIDFSATVYYKDEQGGDEPGGDEPEPQPKDLYWYIGLTQPTAETVIANDLATEYDATTNPVTEASTGWRLIGTTLDGYTYDAQTHTIVLNPDYNSVDYYIAFPGTLRVKDGLGTDITSSFTNIGTVTINEVTYNIYTEQRDEFGMIIY